MSKSQPQLFEAVLRKRSYIHSDLEADIRLVDWRNDKGASPLCTACRKGSLEAVQTLLSLRASVDLEDNQGDTPLHYAASYGHLPIVRMLLHQGASAFAKNNLGYTASDVAFSFEVEQEIQNTVRSALEANKRLRSAKISAAAVTLDLRKRDVPTLSDDEDGSEASPVFEGRGNPMDKLQTPKSVVSPHSRTPVAKPLPSSIPPSLSILTGSSSTPNDAFATPLSKLLSCDRPQPSPSLDPESSKALQRILARDQNAQAGFHASTAYKGLVGPAFPSEPSISPYSNISKESGYFSSRAPVSMRRGRSSSNDVITGSYASSSATGCSSASSSPQSSLAHATSSVKPGKTEIKEVDQIPFGAPIVPLAIRPVPPVPPLPMAPHTALPALMSNSKSSSSSFVNILKRSGSSSAAISVKPNGLVSPLDAVFPPDTALPSGKRSLKHHTSLADLRSHTAPLPNQNQAPAPQMPFISKGTFGFGKSRTRSGT